MMQQDGYRAGISFISVVGATRKNKRGDHAHQPEREFVQKASRRERNPIKVKENQNEPGH
jgi:hypothetical protein